MPWCRWNVSTTWAASPLRSRPVSTKTHVSWGPDGPVHQRGRHRGVDAAGEPADDPLVADLGADLLDRGVDDGRHRPGRLAAADVVEEATQQRLTVGGVDHLGVELHAVDPALHVLEHRDRRLGGAGGDPEALGRADDRVEVAHPHDLVLRLEQHRRLAVGLQVGTAVLALAGARHLPAELLRDELRAVADAEHRHAGLVHHRVDRRGPGDVDALGPAAQDQASRAASGQLLGRDRVRDDLAVDVGFAHPPGDELGVLRAEVDDEDRADLAGAGHRGDGLSGPSRRPGSAGATSPRSGAPVPP